jgi:acyl transferase domain-containing protein
MKISLQRPRSRGTTLRDYDVIFRQVNWRLRSLDRVGHSLGEYSALVAAGVISFKDAVSLRQ